MNTLAQLVECLHCLEEALDLLEMLLRRQVTDKASGHPRPGAAGTGVGAVEAPRGLLVHEYSYDDGSRCLSANLVIPTAQNLANLEADMRALVPMLASEPRDILVSRLEMLVRAYDPCLSCSTHVLDLREGKARADGR